MAKPIPEMPSSVFVALVGRPNVGKSSLTNYLVGEKVAIVTKKPQTTRSRITGVITKGPVQYVLMDTPGIHAARNKLDARMTQTAAASLKDVDVTMMLFEPAGEFTDAELTMVKALQKGGPAIAVINKVDLLDNFAALEARKKQLEEFGCFDHIVTISAKDGTGCDELFAMLKPYGNEGPHYFDDDAFTDMPEKELVAELVREKALLFLREEVPHGIAVVVERFKERPDKDLIDIDVDIYCERKSHKGMIIGKGGQEVPYIRNPSTNNRVKTPLFVLGVDAGKALVYQRLKHEPPERKGPNYCHFPLNEEAGYDEQYFRGLTSEKAVVRVRKGRSVTVWEIKDASYKRNEPLDLRNYATAALEIANPVLKGPEETETERRQRATGSRRLSGGI